MTQHQIKAFTLVELIIVITILAILATIGFMSFQSYTLDARDGQRKSDLTQLSKGLEIYQTKNAALPNPDEQTVTIMSGGLTISVQGYVGINVLKKLRSSEMKDSKDKNYYTYTVNGDKTKYQLLSMLETNTNLAYNNILNQTYATDYTSRYPYTKGNKVGIFFSGTTNTPLQETKSGSIDLAGAYSGTTFKVMFANSISNSGTINSTGINLPAQIQTITNTTATNQTSILPINDGHGFFKGVLYTGNGGTQSITGLGFRPDFVWTKQRNGTREHVIADSIRGIASSLFSDSTSANDTNPARVISFDSDGFKLGSDTQANENSYNYIAWCINAPTQFSGTTNNGKAYTGKTNGSWFSMVKHTENGTNTYSSFPHGLTIRPSLIIHKNLTTAGNWLVRYEDGNKLLTLNSANAATDYNFTGWSTSTTMRSLLDSAINDNIMTYSFASVPGVTKVGKYIGTGVSGNNIDLGFQPAFVMIKNLQDNGSQWDIYDNKRGTSYLSANTIGTELSGYNVVLTTNGFRIDNIHADWNKLSGEYLYLAIAE